MSDQRPFGRRQSLDLRSARLPAAAKTRDGAFDRIARLTAGPSAGTSTASEAASALGQRSGRLGGAADLAAFAGALIVLVGGMLWPANPFALEELAGWIAVPAELLGFWRQMPVDLLPARPGDALVRVGFENWGVPVLAVMGLVAILQRRWLLAASVAAIFAAPWPLIGFELLPAPVVLALYAIVAPFRLFALSTRTRLILAPLMVVGGGVALPLALGLLANLLARGPGDASHRRIAISTLQQNEERATTPGSSQRLTSFVTLGPEFLRQPAAAYVIAQELALRGDRGGAARALEDARQRGFVPSASDRRRMNAIEAHVAAAGLYGQAQKDTVAQAYEWARLPPLVMLVIGCAAFAIGPLIALVARRTQWRASRIADLGNALSANRQKVADGQRAAASQGPVTSIAASDGAAVAASMTVRARIYAFAALVCGALAASCLTAAWLLWLPPSTSNAAFAEIAVPFGTVEWIAKAGAAVTHQPFTVATLREWLFPWGLLAAAAVAVLLARSIGWQVVSVPIIVLVLGQFEPYMLVGQPLNSIEQRGLAADVRRQLAGAAIRATPTEADRQGFVGVGPLTPSAAIPTFEQARIAGGVAPDPRERSRQRSAPPPPASRLPPAPVIHPSAAAYLLAQVAYLEERPAEAAIWLNRVSSAAPLVGRIHHQRLALMIEWAAANGATVSSSTARPELPGPISRAREDSGMLLRVGAGLGIVSGICLALLGFANHRSRRLGRMIQKRAALG